MDENNIFEPTHFQSYMYEFKILKPFSIRLLV
ncbi:hypothetical protein SAMN05216464_110190 [Mucilaginibacter pineti]|uniref:Uncharacterized protein n=1 Tax=Mucilaginibacter pineti TaxID=1391627 RepID=A0A1G7GKU8_9SPHI|nr:hypothetical protein SAMN05216464_110190 [Mucilaginibacter pineti]